MRMILSAPSTCAAIVGALLPLTIGAQEPPVAAAPAAWVLKVVTDRPDAIYRAGESVTFIITATENGAPSRALSTVNCQLSKDGWESQPAQDIALTDGRATLTGTLGEPGFLRLRVVGRGKTALAAAGFDPLLIKPSLPAPDDFDAFWKYQKSRLAAVPLQSQLTPVTAPTQGVDAFDVQVSCVGAPVSGYFARPQRANPRSLPAILMVHGAGVRSAGLAFTRWATEQGGMLAMEINAHGIPNGREPAFYKQLADTTLLRYSTSGRGDREKNYFVGVFLRLLRAIDFLAVQPEWDGRTLIVYGTSQGGYQALAAAGLDARVSFICAGVPSGCDHTGMVVNRISGHPKLVTVANGKPVEAEMNAARYFDAMNFAARARTQGAAVTVGFIDTTCAPTSVYAAYNALSGPKKIHADVLAGHVNTSEAALFMQEAAHAHIRAMKKTAR